jgi:hypothetical protein
MASRDWREPCRARWAGGPARSWPGILGGPCRAAQKPQATPRAPWPRSASPLSRRGSSCPESRTRPVQNVCRSRSSPTPGAGSARRRRTTGPLCPRPAPYGGPHSVCAGLGGEERKLQTTATGRSDTAGPYPRISAASRTRQSAPAASGASPESPTCHAPDLLPDERAEPGCED